MTTPAVKHLRIETFIKNPRVPKEEIVGYFVDLLANLSDEQIEQVYGDMFDDGH